MFSEDYEINATRTSHLPIKTYLNLLNSCHLRILYARLYWKVNEMWSRTKRHYCISSERVPKLWINKYKYEYKFKRTVVTSADIIRVGDGQKTSSHQCKSESVYYYTPKILPLWIIIRVSRWMYIYSAYNLLELLCRQSFSWNRPYTPWPLGHGGSGLLTLSKVNNVILRIIINNILLYIISLNIINNKRITNYYK